MRNSSSLKFCLACSAPAAKSSNGFKWATAVLSVALIAMIAVLAPIIAKTSKPGKSGKTPGVSYASDYVVFIDVNPSVRLDVSGGALESG